MQSERQAPGLGRWYRSIAVLVLLCSAGFVQAAENFSMKDLDGKTHTLAGYKGKWVVVN